MGGADAQAGDREAGRVSVATEDFNPGIGTGTIGDLLIFPAGDAGVVRVVPVQRDCANTGRRGGTTETGRLSGKDIIIAGGHRHRATDIVVAAAAGIVADSDGLTGSVGIIHPSHGHALCGVPVGCAEGERGRADGRRIGIAAFRRDGDAGGRFAGEDDGIRRGAGLSHANRCGREAEARRSLRGGGNCCRGSSRGSRNVEGAHAEAVGGAIGQAGDSVAGGGGIAAADALPTAAVLAELPSYHADITELVPVEGDFCITGRGAETGRCSGRVGIEQCSRGTTITADGTDRLHFDCIGGVRLDKCKSNRHFT